MRLAAPAGGQGHWRRGRADAAARPAAADTARPAAAAAPGGGGAGRRQVAGLVRVAVVVVRDEGTGGLVGHRDLLQRAQAVRHLAHRRRHARHLPRQLLLLSPRGLQVLQDALVEFFVAVLLRQPVLRQQHVHPLGLLLDLAAAPLWEEVVQLQDDLGLLPQRLALGAHLHGAVGVREHGDDEVQQHHGHDDHIHHEDREHEPGAAGVLEGLRVELPDHHGEGRDQREAVVIVVLVVQALLVHPCVQQVEGRGEAQDDHQQHQHEGPQLLQHLFEHGHEAA
mmetsp:Transcript_38838/g.63887  ORF Transcript_38838/g.63887 Transcript_38838/m.63887 type:complete len:281 (-) Transcript_38838:237-1079(-)